MCYDKSRLLVVRYGAGVAHLIFVWFYTVMCVKPVSVQPQEKKVCQTGLFPTTDGRIVLGIKEKIVVKNVPIPFSSFYFSSVHFTKYFTHHLFYLLIMSLYLDLTLFYLY